jgi:hypothetical protein
MPLYFFHIRHPDRLVSDDEGMDLPNDDAARHEGLESARDIAADSIRRGRSVSFWMQGAAPWGTGRARRYYSQLILAYAANPTRDL